MSKSYHQSNYQEKSDLITGFFGIKFFSTRSEAIKILNRLNVEFLLDEPQSIEFFFKDTNNLIGRACLNFSNNSMISATTYYQSNSYDYSCKTLNIIKGKLIEMYGTATEIDGVFLWRSDFNQYAGAVVSLMIENATPILVFMLYNKKTNKTINTNQYGT